MHDLNYFRTHQHLAPHWAAQKIPGIRGMMTQAHMSFQIGSMEKLTGNVSALISDPDEPDKVLVIWGQTMIVPADKSWLNIDGTEIVLRAEIKVAEKPVPPAKPISAPSSSPAFFTSKPAMPSHPRAAQIDMEPYLRQFEQEVIEKHFGKGARIGMSMMLTQQSSSIRGSDNEYMLTYKAGMMSGTQADGTPKTVCDINESKRIRVELTPVADTSSSSGYMY